MVTIPLTPDPDYKFQVEIEDETVELRVRWNLVEQAWYLDITGVSFTLELLGLKLVGGVDLLKPYAVVELGGLFIIDSEEKNQDPDFDGLGDRYRLIYVTKAERGGLII